jgi:tail tube protein
MADVTGTFYAGDAFIGYGAEIRVGQATGSPQNFVAIPDITTITPGDMTTGIVDITHLRSPDRHREKKGTIRDSGPFRLEGNYRPEHGAHKTSGGDGFSSTHSLVSLWRDVTETDFEIELPADAGSPAIVLEFRGVVSMYQIGQVTVDQKTPFTCEITPLRAYTLPA